MEFLKDFFGYTSNREPEGWLSWQHLLYVTLMVIVTILLGLYFGKKYKDKSHESKSNVLKVTALVMWAFELTKIVLISFRSNDPKSILGMLPLFLCSVQLITIPVAGFTKGKLQEGAIDFVYIFGMISCLAGTYLSANYFDNNPVLSFDPMVSVTTHCISGFACIYVLSSGMVTLKTKNLLISFLLLLVIMCFALIANYFLEETSYESNYMFLTRSAGTPFEICNKIVGGVQILYTIFVGSLYYIVYVLMVGGMHVYKKIKENIKK